MDLMLLNTIKNTRFSEMKVQRFGRETSLFADTVPTLEHDEQDFTSESLYKILRDLNIIFEKIFKSLKLASW